MRKIPACDPVYSAVISNSTNEGATNATQQQEQEGQTTDPHITTEAAWCEPLLPLARAQF